MVLRPTNSCIRVESMKLCLIQTFERQEKICSVLLSIKTGPVGQCRYWNIVCKISRFSMIYRYVFRRYVTSATQLTYLRNVEQRFYDDAVTKRYAKNGGLKKTTFLMKPMILIYNDDNPEMHRQIYDYATTLTFWRTLEEKYRERKRKWLAARADPIYIHKPFRRECTILKTTVPLEIDVKEPDASFSTVTDDYIDASAANDKEFSDVDSELFTDPGDVRHSTLDEEAWARICAEIRALHRKAETKLERRRRLYLWRLALVTVFVIFVMLGGAYLLWKALLTAPSDIPPKQECTIRCYGGAETVVSEIIETVFPEYYEEGKA